MIVVAISIAPTAMVAAILAESSALAASAVAFAAPTFLASLASLIDCAVAPIASSACRGLATAESGGDEEPAALAALAACIAAEYCADMLPASNTLVPVAAGA